MVSGSRLFLYGSCGILGAVVVGPNLLGLHNVQVPKRLGPQETATPRGVGYEDFTYTRLQKLYSKVVKASGVDYPGLTNNPLDLYHFCGLVGKHGPNRTPQIFDSPQKKLAYYINAYNALALLGVCYHYPEIMAPGPEKASIMEVRKGWFGIRNVLKPLFGFCYAQKFIVDGQQISLYDIEENHIKPFRDARVYTAINCANCGVRLNSYLYYPEHLDDQLEASAAAFVNDHHNVRVDFTTRTIYLSGLFKRYRPMFLQYAKNLGIGESFLDFISHYSAPGLKEDFDSAVEDNYNVEFLDYDWTLNVCATADDLAEVGPLRPEFQ